MALSIAPLGQRGPNPSRFDHGQSISVRVGVFRFIDDCLPEAAEEEKKNSRKGERKGERK